MKKLIKNRGYTDKLYFYNFCAVQITIAAIMVITALSGVLGITDLSQLSDIPRWRMGNSAYTQGLSCGKQKQRTSENTGSEGTDKVTKRMKLHRCNR